MTRRRPRALVGVLALVVAVTVPASAPAPAPAAGRAPVAISTGGTKGVYYAYAQALAGSARGLTVQVEQSSGSVENLRRLAQGSAGFAFCAADAIAHSYAPSRTGSRLVAAARLYDDYIHLVVRASSSITSITDLRGRVVSLGPPGSGTALIARRLLDIANVRVADLHTVPFGIDKSVAAMRAGRVDAFFWSGGLPTRGLSQLGSELEFRLVPLGRLAGGMRAKYGFFYRKATIPASSYGQAMDTETLAVPNYLVTTVSADPAVVHRMLAALFGNRRTIAGTVPVARALSVREAIFTYPLPLHPAALRYYRER